MLRSGYGFAANTSSTKGGEDTLNPSSVESDRDSLCHSADGSQGSESDTSSEDQRPNEDGGSTLTEESSDHYLDFPFEFPEELSKASGRKSEWRHCRFATKFFDSGPRTRIYVAISMIPERS